MHGPSANQQYSINYRLSIIIQSQQYYCSFQVKRPTYENDCQNWSSKNNLSKLLLKRMEESRLELQLTTSMSVYSQILMTF